jgi:hypothetical protein
LQRPHILSELREPISTRSFFFDRFDEKLGVKLGYGVEKFHTRGGDAERKYWQAALGTHYYSRGGSYWSIDSASFVELYYRSSIWSKTSGAFRKDKIDSNFGINVGVGFASRDSSFGLTAGLFLPPKLKPKRSKDDDIIPITIGFNYVAYFRGY